MGKDQCFTQTREVYSRPLMQPIRTNVRPLTLISTILVTGIAMLPSATLAEPTICNGQLAKGPGTGTIDGPAGISINNGNDFTNDPNVSIRVVHQRKSIVTPTPLGCTPDPGSRNYLDYLQPWAWGGVTGVAISNDGGFGGYKVRPLDPDASIETVKWTLRESGSERLPKTVYARFSWYHTGFKAPGMVGPSTQLESESRTDDIILDQTAPTVSVESAAIIGRARIRAVRKVAVRTKAVDKTSGVSHIQITTNRKKPGVWIRYKRKVNVNLSARRTIAFVRVKDQAGNASRWRQVVIS
jgi:hypothetical protein